MIEQATSTHKDVVNEPDEYREPRTLVRDVMTTTIVSVRPNTGFEDVARTLRSNSVRAVPVLTAEGRLRGVISESDLMRAARLGYPERPAPGGRWHGGGGAWDRARSAEGMMTTSVISVPPTASLAEAARVMHDRKLGWLPVVDNDRLVGVLGRLDLLSAFSRDDDDPRVDGVDPAHTHGSLMSNRSGSLESARIALDDVDGEVARLCAESPSLSRDRLLAQAYRTRARWWRTVASLSFDDIVAGDLLARAARHAARHDLELSVRYQASVSVHEPPREIP